MLGFIKLCLGKITGKLIEYATYAKYEQYRKKYTIDPLFRFNGQGILLYEDGEIVLGENSYIGSNSTIQSAKGYSVTIGKGCHISHNVRIYTSSNLTDYDFSKKPIPQKTASVIIGDYVWIGANCLITPGITIGANAVVGANSVITKNIPPNEIWGGVPAKYIKIKEYGK